MADREHPLEVAEVERLDRPRQQGKGEARGPAEEGHAREPARPGLLLLDRGSNAPRDVREREEGRPRQELEDGLEDVLAASLPGEPVMDDRYLRGPARHAVTFVLFAGETPAPAQTSR